MLESLKSLRGISERSQSAIGRILKRINKVKLLKFEVGLADRQAPDTLYFEEVKTVLRNLDTGGRSVVAMIDEFPQTAETFLNDNDYLNKHERYFIQYFLLLLSKKQYPVVSEYFKNPATNFRERFKPVYYALLRLTGDDDCHRMPPELSEPVEEILEETKRLAIDYMPD